MSTLTKLALGLIGQLKPALPVGDAAAVLALPPPRLTGGMPLIAALAARQSRRSFSPAVLPAQTLSDLLWAAAGINRHAEGGRTAPSALNAQEVLLYVALPQGLYLYEPKRHELALMLASDVRPTTGYQDFVDTAPLDLVFVADHGRLRHVPASQREGYAFAAAGERFKTSTCIAPPKAWRPWCAAGLTVTPCRRPWVCRLITRCCCRRRWASSAQRLATIALDTAASETAPRSAPNATQGAHMPVLLDQQPDLGRIVSSLAQSSHAPLAEVARLYAHERAELAAAAHCTKFLDVFAARNVRAILRSRGFVTDKPWAAS